MDHSTHFTTPKPPPPLPGGGPSSGRTHINYQHQLTAAKIGDIQGQAQFGISDRIISAVANIIASSQSNPKVQILMSYMEGEQKVAAEVETCACHAVVTNGDTHVHESDHAGTDNNTVPVITSRETETYLQKKQILSSLNSLTLHEYEQLQFPILGYWKIRGLVQPIRFILAYLQINFQDKWYEMGPDLSRETWLKEKFTLGLELPNLPYWIDKKSDIKLTQSRAILRYLARENDSTLLGATPEEHRRIDMLENHIWDCWMALVSLCFRYTEQERDEFLCSMSTQFQLLSNFIGENKWCICDHITYVDFMVYEALYQHKVFKPNCLEGYPKLQQILTQFESIPTIACYMKSPNFIEKPLYTRLAKYYL